MTEWEIDERVRRERSWDACYSEPLTGDVWKVWSGWKEAFAGTAPRPDVSRAVRGISIDSMVVGRATVALIEHTLAHHGLDAVLDAISEAAAATSTLRTITGILRRRFPSRAVSDDCGGVATWRLAPEIVSGGICMTDEVLVYCDGLAHYRRHPQGLWPEAIGQCPEAAKLREVIKQAADPPKPPAREQTLDSFEPLPAVAAALAAAKAFIGGQHRTLVLLGQPGRGKTHLARAIQRAAQALDMTTMDYGAGELGALALRLREYGETGKDAAEAVTEAVRAQLLVLDDLPKAQHCQSLVMDILSRREGWMVVTGQPQEYAALPDAVRSRIEEGAVRVEILGGEDYRRRR